MTTAQRLEALLRTHGELIIKHREGRYSLSTNDCRGTFRTGEGTSLDEAARTLHVRLLEAMESYVHDRSLQQDKLTSELSILRNIDHTEEPGEA